MMATRRPKIKRWLSVTLLVAKIGNRTARARCKFCNEAVPLISKNMNTRSRGGKKANWTTGALQPESNSTYGKRKRQFCLCQLVEQEVQFLPPKAPFIISLLEEQRHSILPESNITSYFHALDRYTIQFVLTVRMVYISQRAPQVMKNVFI